MKTWALLLWALALPAFAHEVRTRIDAGEAVVVTLTYANGEPFAYEKYALYPAGRETPRQTGNTDALGRIAFVPDGVRQWRVQASSADGHGVDLEFAAPDTAAPTTGKENAPRWLLAGFGLSLIFGFFGLAQLFLRKKP